MKPILNGLLGTQFLQGKSPRSKYLPSQEKRLWTSLAVENQKFAADGSPEFQSSMARPSREKAKRKGKLIDDDKCESYRDAF